MKTSKEKILAALSDLIPEQDRGQIVAAVESFVEQVKEELDGEYDLKVDEAYKTIAEEKAEVERAAYEGYAEAYQIICELRDRLEVQKEEFEQALEEGYEQAYQMLIQERSKNENITVDLYDEYDSKLAKIKNYMVDKIDQFLSTKGEEFYEAAKRDVLNDPTMAEHKVALDRIMEVAASYLSDEDYLNATSTKVEDMQKQLEDIKGQQRILEAKNMRLSTENSKLNEAVRQQQDLLTENVRYEQKERLKKARTVEGRGKKVVETEREVLIGEHTNETMTSNDDSDDRGTRFVEQIGESITDQWKHLAGVPSAKKK